MIALGLCLVALGLFDIASQLERLADLKKDELISKIKK